jgi:ubiquitin-like 1-activating enzyme E1 B
MSRATLNDLVEDFLRLELGYGEEFVVNNEIGTLYDVEETENLEKKLSELGKFYQLVFCAPPIT